MIVKALTKVEKMKIYSVKKNSLRLLISSLLFCFCVSAYGQDEDEGLYKWKESCPENKKTVEEVDKAFDEESQEEAIVSIDTVEKEKAQWITCLKYIGNKCLEINTNSLDFIEYEEDKIVFDWGFPDRSCKREQLKWGRHCK